MPHGPASGNGTQAIYSPAKNPRTGKEIYPGLEPGSELGWVFTQARNRCRLPPTDSSTSPSAIRIGTFKLSISIATWRIADKVDNGATSAMDPNLKEFFGRGGKLLMYHGWSDPNISPLNTIHYYESVLNTMGPAAATDSIRLFMFPGMGHCGGGEGPDTFDSIGTLDAVV